MRNRQAARPSIAFQYTGEGKIDLNRVLPNILMATGVTPLQYFTIMDEGGLKLILEKASDIQTFRSAEALPALDQNQLKIIEGRQDKIRCTLNIKINKSVMEMDMADLTEDLARKNDIVVEELYRHPTAYFIEIRVQTSEQADKLLKLGLKVGYIKIPADKIKLKTDINVPQCFRCYSLEHVAATCTQAAGYKICSICGQEGHTWRGCEIPPHCINCGGDHVAVSLTCKKKKDIYKDIRANSGPRTPATTPGNRPPIPRGNNANRPYAQTYAGATRGPSSAPQNPPSHSPPPAPIHPPPPVLPTPTPPLAHPIPTTPTRDQQIMQACATFSATFANCAQIYNALLLANNLTPIVIPQDLVLIPRATPPSTDVYHQLGKTIQAALYPLAAGQLSPSRPNTPVPTPTSSPPPSSPAPTSPTDVAPAMALAAQTAASSSHPPAEHPSHPPTAATPTKASTNSHTPPASPGDTDTYSDTTEEPPESPNSKAPSDASVDSEEVDISTSRSPSPSPPSSPAKPRSTRSGKGGAHSQKQTPRHPRC